jgi:N utilization substance protein B
MQIALAEILSFPNIPVSVSLNEYVEIAKLYSTPKSGSFINGTLDGIVNMLKAENKLTKN